MRTIAIDIPGICQSVCHGLCCANIAEWTKVLLVVETTGDPTNIVFVGSPDFYHGFNAATVKLLCCPRVSQVTVASVTFLHIATDSAEA